MNWAAAPCLGAVILLAVAFSSVMRRCRTFISRGWMAGWCLVVIHFAALLGQGSAQPWNRWSEALSRFALLWAAFLFMFAASPCRHPYSRYWIVGSAAGATTLYLLLYLYLPMPGWLLAGSAGLVGVAPLLTTLLRQENQHPLRRLLMLQFGVLAVFLLLIANNPQVDPVLALNAILFSLYFACAYHLWYLYSRATTGLLITLAGFLCWSAIFALGPVFHFLWSDPHLNPFLWILPVSIVAMGMMLLLLEEQIEHNKYLALHDELTDLPNRRLFQDRLSGAIARARRTGTATALLLVDLDNFKEINDQFGHAAGDMVLRNAGNLFAGRVRRSDTVARTGGDEFCIILDSPVTLDDTRQVTESLSELLAQPMFFDGHPLQIGASIGYAIFPDDANDAETLCVEADLRMYRYKYAKEATRYQSATANLKRPASRTCRIDRGTIPLTD